LRGPRAKLQTRVKRLKIRCLPRKIPLKINFVTAIRDAFYWDSSGKTLYAWTKKLPLRDRTVGEARAALLAIRSAVEEGLNNIKIEGDSQVVMVISAVLTRATTGVEIRPFYL
jgi:ubiquinone biosynthesis protein UbiJ